jgi:gliding motility-associated-like protein
MTKKSIEDFFKDTFENFEAEVKPSVWANIQTGLKGLSIGLLVKMAINKIGTNTFIAIVSSVVAVVTTVVVVNWNGHGTNVKPKPIASNQNVTQPNVSKDVISQESKGTNSTAVNSIKTEGSESKNLKMEETKVSVKPTVKPSENANHITTGKQFSEAPIASIFANPIKGTVPLIVNFSNTGMGKTNKWKYNDGKADDKGANPAHVFETPGKYKVVLLSTDGNGKASNDTVEINALSNPDLSMIPVEITPNGDSIRDAFAFQSDRIVKMNVQIFDKLSGKKVFERDGETFLWNGTTTSGEDLKAGVYFYYVTGEGKKDKKNYEKKGYIQIKR